MARCWSPTTTTAPSTGSGTGSSLRLGRGAALAALLLAPAALASAASFEERTAACLACHGAGGQSRIPDTPSIGGQPAFFVTAQLFLFRRGGRANAPMSEVAKTMSDDDLRAFGEWVSRLPPPAPPSDPPDAARLARGQALARRHPCGVCHNADFSGREQMPRLAHQREEYLLRSMREYKSGARLGYGGAMSQELAGLSDAELADLAHFFAHLPR
jgi:cytochrome c553